MNPPAEFALKRHLPAVDAPWVSLGEYPTPVEPLPAMESVWLKREDVSSPLYGGNKIRTLETLLGDARSKGIHKVWTLGAYGSNQAIALIVHGKRLGFETGGVLFPQRATPTGSENLRAAISHADELKLLRSIATFPLYWLARRRAHNAGKIYLVAPGGATPLGALGHVGAALEISEQIQRGEMPEPKRIVLGVGSTCTTAGLLVGLPLAKHLGLWRGELPEIVAVRVTPWPVTARSMILRLAKKTARYLRSIGGPDVSIDPRMLSIDGKQLGGGYAKPTQSGLEAVERFAAWDAPPLDTTYAAKSGAALLAMQPVTDAPTLYWCTKSSALPPLPDADKLNKAPAHIQRWLNKADNWIRHENAETQK